MIRKSLLKKRSLIVIFIISIWGIHFYFALPRPLFKDSYCTVLNDRNKEILSVKIAADEQWRFPAPDTLPEKYKQALITFEDGYFYYHIGVNPFSMARAIYHNSKKGKVTSGGSTISMQVIRLMRQQQARTIQEKLIEIYLSVRLELGYSKEEILLLYATHAPFGGNIVGIEAASIRYFGRALKELSWAEAATLAVLPNNPAYIFPGKNTPKLLEKRNKLLELLHTKNHFDQLTLDLAKSEPIPTQFLNFNQDCPHLLALCVKKHGEGKVYTSTINHHYQKRANEVIQHHMAFYAGNHIYNAGAVIFDIKKNEVIAYVGNTKPFQGQWHNNFVDVVQAPRSTGSILKPFLYAAMLNEGIMLPQSLLPDIPTYIQGFAPKNYSKSHEGAVKADAALARSLNIPFVWMLKEYRYERFHSKLQEFGLSTITQAPDHYGLSLILGGAEANLWELTTAYTGMARTLNKFERNPINKPYSKSYYGSPSFLIDEAEAQEVFESTTAADAAAIWHTFEALKEVNRPDNEGQWQLFESSQKVAWKTGTSWGHRDAWAIGVTSDYAVGVWVGNADGEGRPGLIGVTKAAPILFSIFNFLPNSPWFKAPKREMQKVQICKHSGEKASENCKDIIDFEITKKSAATAPCNYCKRVWLNEKGQQVNSSCENPNNMKEAFYFVLPPVEEWYYKQKTSFYKSLPPFAANCIHENTQSKPMDIIYPSVHSKIYIPLELTGSRGNIICKASHRSGNNNSASTIYWHLNDTFIGKTNSFHEIAIQASAGKHRLILVDEEGYELVVPFEILGK